MSTVQVQIEKIRNECESYKNAQNDPNEPAKWQYIESLRTLNANLSTCLALIRRGVTSHIENEDPSIVDGQRKKIVFNTSELKDNEKRRITLKSKILKVISLTSAVIGLVSLVASIISALFIYVIFSGQFGFYGDDKLLKKLGVAALIGIISTGIFINIFNVTHETELERKGRVLNSKNFAYFINTVGLENHYNLTHLTVHRIYRNWKNDILFYARKYEQNKALNR